MKRSISQCYVDSSHQISFTDLFYEKWNKFNENKYFALIVHIKYLLLTSFMKNEINLMKTSISQCYVDSAHQISRYELLVWKMK